MIKAMHTERVQSKPNFTGLMELYGRNYRLLTALLECIDGGGGIIQNKAGYTFKVSQKHCSSYTQNLVLHYGLHVQRHGREVVIAIADFKVRLYLDTHQAAVIFSEIKLKQYLPRHGFFVLCRAKWYHNYSLGIILRNFFSY